MRNGWERRKTAGEKNPEKREAPPTPTQKSKSSKIDLILLLDHGHKSLSLRNRR